MNELFTHTIWLSIAIVAFIGGVPLWLALLTVRLQRLAEASAQFKSAEPSIRGLSQQILEDSSFRMYLDARIKHSTASPFSGGSRFVKPEPKRGAGWSVQESLAEAIDQSELLEAVRSQVRRLTESGHARGAHIEVRSVDLATELGRRVPLSELEVFVKSLNDRRPVHADPVLLRHIRSDNGELAAKVLIPNHISL